MERNEGTNDLGVTSGQNDAAGISGAGSTQPANSSFDFGDSAQAGDQVQSLGDRAKSAVSGAGERLAGAGSTLRERAGSAKDRLADVLESGAGRLRERAGRTAGASADPALAGATDAGTTAISNDGRTAQVAERVAGGMQTSAEWLRDADLDSLKTGVEQQVREHPGRTLLIAAGLGYLIGRAFRNNQ